MKPQLIIFLCCLAFLQSYVWAEPGIASVERPQGNQILFSEVFDDDWDKRWTITKHPDYQGEWNIGEGIGLYNITGDNGLIVSSVAKKHGISAKFDHQSESNEDLVVQYEVRFQKELDCGGAYIKLLTAGALKDSQFSNDVPYTIMFGPDRCGHANDKVHFIVRYKNPKTEVYEEKHLISPPPTAKKTHTHLYTLWLKKDNSFEIFIDQKSLKSGNLIEDFQPPFNPPKEINDPTDVKPTDWEDSPKIPDPDATKPPDWDEEAPATIVDESDTKPEEWLDDESAEIPHPESKKPDDWDDEIDGDWVAPMVPNPRCAEFGCGEWKPRLIPNPDYKGIWRAPLIDNPKYKGEWAPRKIPNPDYFYVEHPQLDPIDAIGIEIWTMNDGILFDNIIITHDKDIADGFAAKTWVKRHAIEQEIIDAEEAKNNPPFIERVTKTIQTTAGQISTFASDPNNYLIVVGTIAVATLVPILLCFLVVGGRKQEPTKKPKQNKKEDNDEQPKEEKPSQKTPPEKTLKRKKRVD